MGIGYVASNQNYYEGRLTLAGSAPISAGTLVSGDFAAGTATLGVTANKPVFFVAQEIDEPIEYGIADLDQVIKVGKHLKLAPLMDGAVYKTTEVNGSVVAGDVCNFTSGKFAKSTAGTAGADFIVTQVDQIADTPIYSLLYEKAAVAAGGGVGA